MDYSTDAIGEENVYCTTEYVAEEEWSTTHAIGEEDVTSAALGEEGPILTSDAIGEEGPILTSDALGEEGDPYPYPAVEDGSVNPFGAF